MDGEEPSFRPQGPPTYHGSSVKRPFAQLNIDDEWPTGSASGSNGRAGGGVVVGSDGEEGDRHKRARSESDTSGDESLRAFSASSSSQAGSSGSSSSESNESSSGLASSYNASAHSALVQDDSRNLRYVQDAGQDSGTRFVDEAPGRPRYVAEGRHIEAGEQTNLRQEIDGAVDSSVRQASIVRHLSYPPLPVGRSSEQTSHAQVWPNAEDHRSSNRLHLPRVNPGETGDFHSASDLFSVNPQEDLQPGNQTSFTANRESRYSTLTGALSEHTLSPTSHSVSSRILPSPSAPRPTVLSRSSGSSASRGQPPPLPTDSLSSLSRSPLPMSAAARIGAASNELPRPLHAHSSGLAVEDGSIEDHPTEDDPIEDAAVNWRNERYRVNLERSGTGLPRIAPSHSRSWEIVSDDDGIQSGGTGLPRVEPSYSGSFEIVSDDDGIQSSMNRVFEDLRSFNETLEATRESISLFLNDRPSPVHGSGDDHSSTRAAVESRRESYASRQPLRTPFRGRLDQEEDTGSSLSNRSVPNGTRNTYNPFPTTRAAADIRSSPDPLDLINSGDRDDLASRFRLRAVSSRSFMARRTNESSNASRLPPPSLAPRTESHLHRALQLEGWEADDILTSLDERANDWFPPLASPRADADHERRPSDNSLSELGDSRTRWTGIIRPDPPVGLRSRGDGISSASDYRRRTSWASSAATSRQSVESRLEEDPRRLLAEEHRTPFSVPRPPWREGQWTESAGTATQSNPSFNPPALIPLLGSGASRTSLSRAPSASSYRSTAVAYIPDWRRLGERNIPPAYRRSGQTRLPVILPPLTRAASARRLPSIATLPENDDSSRDEVPGVRPPTSSAGSAPTALPLPSCPHLPPLGQWDDADESELATASTDGSVPLGPFGRWGEPDQMQSAATSRSRSPLPGPYDQWVEPDRLEPAAAASSQSSLFGQWDGPDHLEPVATGGSGSQYRGIDLNAYHDGPFRASLRRSIELSRSRTSSQPTTRLSDSSSRPSLSALHRQRNSSEVSSRSQREALAHRLGRLHPLHTATDEHERSISRETRHPSPRRLAQRPPATNARPSRAGSDRPLPDPRRVDSALVSAVRGRFSRPREADISSPDWWDQSPAELPDDIFSELNDLPGALDVDIRPPTRSHNEFQQAIQVLRNEGRRDSVYGRRLRRRPWDDMDATDASNETQASRELEEWASRRTSARPRSTTARPTDLIREPSRRATSQRSQSRSPSRGNHDHVRSHFERHARLRAMQSQIRQRQQGQDEVRSRAELPLHTFLASRYRARRNTGNLGDYMRDQDFDSSYETLLALASSVGDALPRSTPEHVIASMPTGFYKDWADAESETRCPICLDDYKSLDPVLKMHDCRHWLHKECLETWLRSATTCPVCRQRVRPQRDRAPSPPVAGPSVENLPNQSGEEDSDENPWQVEEEVDWLMPLPMHRHPRHRPRERRGQQQ